MKRQLLFLTAFIFFGATGQVSLVRDFYPGSTGQLINSGTPSPLIIHNNKLYLAASDQNGRALYELNNLSGNVNNVSSMHSIIKRGPEQLARIYEGAVSSGSNLFFYQQQSGSTNDVLYVFNGTSSQALDTVPSSLLNSYTLIPLPGNKVLYMGHSATTGFELFVSDGTIAGTLMVKDINPGSATSFGSPFPAFLGFEFNGKAYFVADDGVSGLELWSSDGTPANTQLFTDLNPSGSSFAVGFAWSKNASHFLVNVVGGTQKGIVTSDGTLANTHFLHEGSLVNLFCWDANSYIGKFKHTGDKMYYSVGGNSSLKIYQTNGVPGDTLRIYNGPGHPLAFGTEFNNELYFISSGPQTNQSTLEKLNISANSFETIKTFTSSGGSASFGPMIQNDTLLFFMEMDATDDGLQYYISDGTSAGTSLLYDFTIGIMNGGPNAATGYYTLFNNEIVFGAQTDTYGSELWKMGGTTVAGIESAESLKGATLYPNPAKNVVNISFAGNEVLESVCLMDLNGKILLETTGSSISLENLNAGAYLVAIKSNSSIEVKKLLVE